MKTKLRKPRPPRLRKSLRLLAEKLAAGTASGTDDQAAIRAACRDDAEYRRTWDRYVAVCFGNVEP